MQLLLVAPGSTVCLSASRSLDADSHQVAGEITTYRTLSIGFVVAVFVVGILYIIVNVVFVSSHPVETMQQMQLTNTCWKLTALPYTGENIQYAAKVGSISITIR